MTLLETLLQSVDEKAARYSRLDAYYHGRQPLAFLAPEARTALGDRLTRMCSNIPRLAVTSLSERLRVTGFTGADVWPDWLAADLDQLASLVHREALTLGAAYVLVWADSNGNPTVTVESARQVAVLRDPATRQITAAVKRWEDGTSTWATLFTAETVTTFRAKSPGATITGFQQVDQQPNPLGAIPLVEFSNSDRVGSDGCSEISDLIPLVDALNKSLADMMVSSEFYARPRRFATGIELEEDEEGEATNPFPESDRMMIAESEQAKFGQLEAGSMAGYTDAVNVLLGQIMAVSALPAHYLGVMSNQPASADALRAAEASLTARAEARQQTFGRAWEQVARLIVAVRTGALPGVVRVVWADAATRSVAQEADAVVKLFSAGLLPATYALKRLGYSDDEINEIQQARRAEALERAGTDLQALIA